MSSTRADAHDRYSAAAGTVINGYKLMASAAEDILAEDLTDLLGSEDAHDSGITGISEVAIRIEWADDSPDQTITAIRNHHGVDVSDSVLARNDGGTLAKWLTNHLVDLPGTGYLTEALRGADDLPADINIAVAADQAAGADR